MEANPNVNFKEIQKVDITKKTPLVRDDGDPTVGCKSILKSSTDNHKERRTKPFEYFKSVRFLISASDESSQYPEFVDIVHLSSPRSAKELELGKKYLSQFNETKEPKFRKDSQKSSCPQLFHPKIAINEEKTTTFTNVVDNSTCQQQSRHENKDNKTVDSDTTGCGEGKIFVSAKSYDRKDSFPQAIDVFDYFNIKPNQSLHMKLYKEALKLVARGEVICRKIRTEMAFVHSKEDFLAKVHCLRQGYNKMFQKDQAVAWLAENFGSIVDELLNMTEFEFFQSASFNEAYVDAIIFFFKESNQQAIIQDLNCNGIIHLSFYDIALCFFLLDTLEHIEEIKKKIIIPENHSSVSWRLIAYSTINTFHDEYYRRDTGAYSANGFLIRMYRACTYVALVLAVGLKGPPSYLQKACYSFEKQTKKYVEDLFNFNVVNYTTTTQMADDLWALTKERVSCLQEELKLLVKSKKADDAQRTKYLNDNDCL